MAKLIVIIGFALSFAAGLVIGTRSRPGADGTVSSASKGPTTSPSSRFGGWLSAQLSLTPDQREKLDEIWSETAQKGRGDREDRRREYRRERDVAIADLIPAGRMDEYDRIIDAYGDRVAGLDRESRDAYDAAVERTKQILSSPQRVRYEEILKQHKWGPSGSSRDRHPGHRSETRPMTTPASSSKETSKGAES